MRTQRRASPTSGATYPWIVESNEPWRIEKEPHNYPDGTTHFNHVRQTARVNGEPLTVTIAEHLTPELAELLVLMRNNLPELIRQARLGLRAQR